MTSFMRYLEGKPMSHAEAIENAAMKVMERYYEKGGNLKELMTLETRLSMNLGTKGNVSTTRVYLALGLMLFDSGTLDAVISEEKPCDTPPKGWFGKK